MPNEVWEPVDPEKTGFIHKIKLTELDGHKTEKNSKDMGVTSWSIGGNNLGKLLTPTRHLVTDGHKTEMEEAESLAMETWHKVQERLKEGWKRVVSTERTLAAKILNKIGEFTGHTIKKDKRECPVTGKEETRRRIVPQKKKK